MSGSCPDVKSSHFYQIHYRTTASLPQTQHRLLNLLSIASNPLWAARWLGRRCDREIASSVPGWYIAGQPRSTQPSISMEQENRVPTYCLGLRQGWRSLVSGGR